MIENIFFSVLLVALIAGMVMYGIKLWGQYQFKKLMRDIDRWLEGYRSRLTGFNRFTISRQLVEEIFEDRYCYNTLSKAWPEMMSRKWVILDKIDNEWIVKPNHPDQEVKPLNLFQQGGN